jgi:transcriptional regulator GlxA family with amidase domain
LRDIFASAGITAAIALALALISEDLGPSVARDVARQLVVYAQRPGGQTQHSRLLELGPGDSRFAELNARMCQRLDARLDVNALAAHAKMSPRSFARAYSAEAGVTPAKAVERLRVEAARAWIEAGEPSLQGIAERTRLRRHRTHATLVHAALWHSTVRASAASTASNCSSARAARRQARLNGWAQRGVLRQPGTEHRAQRSGTGSGL